jgi:hypothetical protein
LVIGISYHQFSIFHFRGHVSALAGKKVQGNFQKIACTEFETD